MRLFTRVFIAFMCGMVTAINLSKLVDVNPSYEGSWWKVAFAVLLCLALAARPREKHDR